MLVIYKGDVFDVTDFADMHPGGDDLIIDQIGNDISELYHDENSHAHSKNAMALLKDYKYGEMGV
jgi:4-hydroxysphinganine ceramide fatty acyl 2-hydroxylase